MVVKAVVVRGGVESTSNNVRWSHKILAAVPTCRCQGGPDLGNPREIPLQAL